MLLIPAMDELRFEWNTLEAKGWFHNIAFVVMPSTAKYATGVFGSNSYGHDKLAASWRVSINIDICLHRLSALIPSFW